MTTEIKSFNTAQIWAQGKGVDMKICSDDKKLLRTDLIIGEVFRHLGGKKTYMVVLVKPDLKLCFAAGHELKYPCVNIETGCMAYTDSDTEVERVSGCFKLTPSRT